MYKKSKGNCTFDVIPVTIFVVKNAQRFWVPPGCFSFNVNLDVLLTEDDEV